MTTAEIEVEVGKEKISMLTSRPNRNPSHWVLFLFGGSRTRGKERFAEWQKYLTQENIGSISFDYSGTGKSTGHFFDSSLANRIDETVSVIRWIKKNIHPESFTLCGGSMGAYVALGASRIFPKLIKNLILFCPAAYAKECHSLHFCRKFTRCIRRSDSWKNSLAFRWIERFTGRILLLIPEDDEIIPPHIPLEYQRRAKNAADVHSITIPHAAHNLLNPKTTRLRFRQQIYRNSVEFIKGNHDD